MQKNILNFIFNASQNLDNNLHGGATEILDTEVERLRQETIQKDNQTALKIKADALAAKKIRMEILTEGFKSLNTISRYHNTQIRPDRNNIISSFLTLVRENPTILNKSYVVRFSGESGYGDGIGEIFRTLISENFDKSQGDTQIPFFVQDGDFINVNPENTNYDGFKILGKFIAHTLLTNNQLNIRLHPIILYCLTHMKFGEKNRLDEETYKNLFYAKIQTIFKRNLSGYTKQKLAALHRTEKKVIDKYIIQDFDNINESEFFNNWLIVRDVMMRHQASSFNDFPKYYLNFPDSQSEWMKHAMTKLCFQSKNFMCQDPSEFSSKQSRQEDKETGVDRDLERGTQVPFSNKDFLVNFNVLTILIYSRITQLTHLFNGFFELIPPEFMHQISTHELHELIAGREFIDIGEFLALVNIVGPSTTVERIDGKTKEEIETEIKNIIKKNAETDDTYLNDMVYLISGRRNLPFVHGTHPTLNFYDEARDKINSQTCFAAVNFPKYVNKETIEGNLQKETLIIAGEAITQDGGSYREKYLKYKNKYMKLKNQIV